MADKPRIRIAAGRSVTHDSFQNLAANLGYGANNLTSGSTYGFNPITRNRVLLGWAYRGSWIARQVVDAVADDMTREGIHIESDMEPKLVEDMQAHIAAMGIWGSLNEAIKWARLYGGACAMINIDGQDASTPLRLETVGKGSFLGLTVYDRWQLQPHLEDLIDQPGPRYGLPRYYEISLDRDRTPIQPRVHYSRLIRFEGNALPYWEKMAENYWGLSVLEPMWDRLIAFDSTTTGVAQLVYRAHLRTLKVPGLREVVSAGGEPLAGLMAQVNFLRLTQSNEGIAVIDGEDEMSHFTQTFSGLDSVLIQLGQQLSGAVQIPLVRLFGQSPAGLSSTGESDVRFYYDGIRAKQTNYLKMPVNVVLSLMHRSLFGKPLPAGFAYNFNPLWQMSDEQKAQNASTIMEAIGGAYDRSLISAQVALKELREQSRQTGVFTNITAEDISKADENPPDPNEDAPPAPAPGGGPAPAPTSGLGSVIGPGQGASPPPGDAPAKDAPKRPRKQLHVHVE